MLQCLQWFSSCSLTLPLMSSPLQSHYYVSFLVIIKLFGLLLPYLFWNFERWKHNFEKIQEKRKIKLFESMTFEGPIRISITRYRSWTDKIKKKSSDLIVYVTLEMRWCYQWFNHGNVSMLWKIFFKGICNQFRFTLYDP